MPTRSPRVLWLSALLILPTLAGCGSGSPSALVEREHVLTSLDSRDGTVRSDGVVLATGEPLGVGDSAALANGVNLRVVYAFETGHLGPAAEILEARLHVYQGTVWGDPYMRIGDLVVDHVDLGPDLDSDDFAGGIRTNDIGTLSTTSALEWKELDVTAAVRANRENGDDFSEFRLRFRFSIVANDMTDMIQLNDGADVLETGYLPQLVVRTLGPRYSRLP